MTRENKYESLIIHLNNNHIYPGSQVKLGLGEETVTGLRVQCPPILKDDKLSYLRGILEGKDCLVSWVGNGADYILIKLKQHNDESQMG